jgi:hypothetical protein
MKAWKSIGKDSSTAESTGRQSRNPFIAAETAEIYQDGKKHGVAYFYGYDS